MYFKKDFSALCPVICINEYAGVPYLFALVTNGMWAGLLLFGVGSGGRPLP
ncbi:MAG: hypothetical protein ACK4NY_16440 [Spirosomataceae bacterium]